ncbi:MAG: hypothetical protein ACYTBX_16865 [Planctomycetota bacterium]|jgi:hypothetical protein
MDETIRKKDIEGLNERMEQLQDEQRANTVQILRRINARASSTISAIFRESRKIREEITHQTIMLKMLQDNLEQIEFDDSIPLSSKVELSVGGEIFGTGAKWVLDIDLAKAGKCGKDILEAFLLAPGVPDWVKEKAKPKLKKLLEGQSAN